jgi:hypothetical protein
MLIKGRKGDPVSKEQKQHLDKAAVDIADILHDRDLDAADSSAVLLGVLACIIVDRSHGDIKSLGQLCAGLAAELSSEATKLFYERFNKRGDAARN